MNAPEYATAIRDNLRKGYDSGMRSVSGLVDETCAALDSLIAMMAPPGSIPVVGRMPVPTDVAKRAIALAAHAFDVPEHAIATRNKVKPVVRARYAVVALVSRMCPAATLREVGAVVGKRHHATVLCALHRASELAATDASWRAAYDSCLNAMGFKTAQEAA